MKRYVKNPAVSQVFLPGVGRIEEGRVLVGNEFEKYAPRFLVEVPDAPAGVPLESTEPQRTPSLLTEPAPTPPSPPVPERLEEVMPTPSAPPVEEKRGRGRPRKNG